MLSDEVTRLLDQIREEQGTSYSGAISHLHHGTRLNVRLLAHEEEVLRLVAGIGIPNDVISNYRLSGAILRQHATRLRGDDE